MLKSFARYYKPHWKLFVLDMVCALCICLVDLAFPIVSRFPCRRCCPDRCSRRFSW